MIFTVSYAKKYNVVDCWMLLQKANEEFILTKNEMAPLAALLGNLTFGTI
jgi:hypothetical protein